MTGLPPGRRVHQSINAIRQLEVTDSVLSSIRRVLWALPAEASPLVSRETGPSPEKRLPCRPRQSGGARCLYRTAVLHQQTALDLSRPKRMYLPRSSAAAGRPIPSGTTYSTGDPYRALGRGITLLLTCYGIRPTCLRGGRGHHVSSAAWNNGFCAR